MTHTISALPPSQLFGAITDSCGATDNNEVYVGGRKNIQGNGAGGSYCTQGDSNARWMLWFQ